MKVLALVAVVALVAIVAYFIWSRVRGEAFSGGSAVTYFYLPECPWCKKFKPEWEKFKASAAKAGIATKEVNGEEDRIAVDEKGIKGFPTVLVGDKEYQGERTAEALMKAATSAKP